MGTIRIGSLCSGIGGLDVGLELALEDSGYAAKVVWQIEKAPYAQAVLRHHWPNAEQHDALKTCGAHNLAPVDLVVGGIPCQPASFAGKRRGASDERWLWPDALRIVRELRPRYVVFENVPGLRSLEKGEAFAGILRGLAQAGYDAEWRHLRASDPLVGAPHRRERIFILAWLADPERGGRDGAHERLGQGNVEADAWHGGVDGSEGCLVRCKSRSAEGPGARGVKARELADPGCVGDERPGEPQELPGSPGSSAREEDQRQRVRNAPGDGRQVLAHRDSRGREGVGLARHRDEQGAPGIEPDRCGAGRWRHGEDVADGRCVDGDGRQDGCARCGADGEAAGRDEDASDAQRCGGRGSEVIMANPNEERRRGGAGNIGTRGRGESADGGDQSAIELANASSRGLEDRDRHPGGVGAALPRGGGRSARAVEGGDGGAVAEMGRIAAGLPRGLDGGRLSTATTPSATDALCAFPGWPARPGEEQYSYEPPRTVSAIPYRSARLRCLGNAVVPWQAYVVALRLAEIMREGPGELPAAEATVDKAPTRGSLWSTRTTTGACVVRVEGVQTDLEGQDSVLLVEATRGAAGLDFAASPARWVGVRGFLGRYSPVTAEEALSRVRATVPKKTKAEGKVVAMEDPRQTGLFPVAGTSEYDAVVVHAGAGSVSLALREMGLRVLALEDDEPARLAHASNAGECLSGLPTSARATFVYVAQPMTPPPDPPRREDEEEDEPPDGTTLALLQALEVARAVRARGLVVELVGGKRGSMRSLPRLLAEIELLGLRRQVHTVDGAYLGLAQHRPIVFLVAWDGEGLLRWPTPTHAPPGNLSGLSPFLTMRECLGLEGEFVGRYRTERGEWKVCLDPNGPVPTIGPRGVPAPLWAKLADEPARLSLGALARLQGLPEGFAAEGSAQERLRQIGTATPPVMVQAVTKPLLALLSNETSAKNWTSVPSVV